jgi:hypothetical protein
MALGHCLVETQSLLASPLAERDREREWQKKDNPPFTDMVDICMAWAEAPDGTLIASHLLD